MMMKKSKKLPTSRASGFGPNCPRDIDFQIVSFLSSPDLYNLLQTDKLRQWLVQELLQTRTRHTTIPGKDLKTDDLGHLGMIAKHCRRLQSILIDVDKEQQFVAGAPSGLERLLKHLVHQNCATLEWLKTSCEDQLSSQFFSTQLLWRLANCPRLKYLNLGGFFYNSKPILATSSQRLEAVTTLLGGGEDTHLEHLELCFFENSLNSFIFARSAAMSRLVHLAGFSIDSERMAQQVVGLATTLKHLRHLEFNIGDDDDGRIWPILDEGLNAFSASLTTLSIVCANVPRGKQWTRTCWNLPRLTSLEFCMPGDEDVPGADSRVAIVNAPKLTSLRVQLHPSTALATMLACPHLEHIVCLATTQTKYSTTEWRRDSQLWLEALHNHNNWPNLVELERKGWFVPVQTLGALQSRTRLRVAKLHFGATHCPPTYIRQFLEDHATTLESLYLTSRSKSKQPGSSATEDIAVFLPRALRAPLVLPALQRLSIPAATDATFWGLTFPALDEIVLGADTRIRDIAASVLDRAPALRRLTLNRCADIGVVSATVTERKSRSLVLQGCPSSWCTENTVERLVHLFGLLTLTEVVCVGQPDLDIVSLLVKLAPPNLAQVVHSKKSLNGAPDMLFQVCPNMISVIRELSGVFASHIQAMYY